MLNLIHVYVQFFCEGDFEKHFYLSLMVKGQTGACISGQLIMVHLQQKMVYIICVDLKYPMICKLV
jgi:hypothetical protein